MKSSAIARRSPCLSDTASVVGLSALARERPHDWHRLLIRHAATGRTDAVARVSDVVGTRLDAACLPRSTADLGRLRSARWCASVLARHAGSVRLLGATTEIADQLEAQLVEHHGIAPSSARKVRAHLVQLRDCLARALGVPVPAIAPPPEAPAAWTPRLTWADYASVRAALAPSERIACDLIAACRLRPSAVLRLVVGDLGVAATTVCVRGRRRVHHLSVPTFLRGDLVVLADARAPAELLFPGRTDGKGMSVVTLRRRFQVATRRALGADLDLRDLADLAAATLGPRSANPSGRGAALRRVASRWIEPTSPPSPRGQPASLVVNPRPDRAALEQRVSALERTGSRTTARIAGLERRTRGAIGSLTSRSNRSEKEQWQLLRDLESLRDDLCDRLAALEKRIAPAPRVWSRQQNAIRTLRADVSALEHEAKARDKRLERARSALRVSVALTGALALDRISDHAAPVSSGAAAGPSAVVGANGEHTLQRLLELLHDAG